MSVNIETFEFNAHTRCDKCGGQAYHLVTKGQLALLFCGHHGNLHHNKLVAEGWSFMTDTAGWERLATPVHVNL